jgi:hypothetical protein
VICNFEYYYISQVLQLFAFKIVSAVVKVFEFIKINVYSTFKFYIAREKSIGSTFAKNRIFLPFDFYTYYG